MKTITRTIILILCAALLPIRTSAASPLPDVSAEAAVLYEPEGERWVYEKNADARLPMASTTKVMTALIALRLLPLDAVYRVPDEACGIEGSSLYLKSGDTVSVKDLLYALLLRSANDAASALAILACGSEAEFAKEMNAEASRLGLKNTHFENPHGLDSEGHFSSARDMALILDAAMQDERFVEICKTKNYTVSLDGRSQQLQNHNKLLFMSENAVCGKTGFTKKSGRCLVSSAEKDGVLLIAVTLRAPNDWTDHLKLFESGFESFERRLVVAENDAVRVDVAGGERDFVLCRPSEELFAVCERDSSVRCDVLLPSVIFAPVKAGDVLGVIRAYENERLIGEVCLVADADLEEKEEKLTPIKKLFRALFKK